MNNKEQQPKVSVITVCFNSVKTIERTIQSVLAQKYDNIEYILIDGNSTDGTQDIIQRYLSNISYYVSEKDNGIYDAMNKALRISSGTLISILNSDDWYEPDIVSKVIDYYALNPQIDIFHGLLRFYNIKNKADSIVGHYSNFLDKGMIEHPTCFIKKSLYDNIGLFNINYRSAADYDWTLRARLKGAQFMLLPIVITNFSRGGMSDSSLGFLEELEIKKKNKVISYSKYLRWKIFTNIKSILKHG